MLLKWNLPNKVSKYRADILPELYTPPSMGMVIHFGGKMLIFYSCKKKKCFLFQLLAKDRKQEECVLPLPKNVYWPKMKILSYTIVHPHAKGPTLDTFDQPFLRDNFRFLFVLSVFH